MTNDKLTWKQIQEIYNNKNNSSIYIPIKSKKEQLIMKKEETMEYIKHHSLCDEAEIKLLTDKELVMEDIKHYRLCDEAEIKLLTDKELVMEYIKHHSLCDEAQIKLFNMKD